MFHIRLYLRSYCVRVGNECPRETVRMRRLSWSLATTLYTNHPDNVDIEETKVTNCNEYSNTTFKMEWQEA